MAFFSFLPKVWYHCGMSDTAARLRRLVDTAHRDPSMVGGTLMAFEELLIKAADELERAEALQQAYNVLLVERTRPALEALEEFDRTGIRPT